MNPRGFSFPISPFLVSIDFPLCKLEMDVHLMERKVGRERRAGRDLRIFLLLSNLLPKTNDSYCLDVGYSSTCIHF